MIVAPKLFIRQFFTAKHPEIAAKFDEKEKEEGLVRPDQVFEFLEDATF